MGKKEKDGWGVGVVTVVGEEGWNFIRMRSIWMSNLENWSFILSLVIYITKTRTLLHKLFFFCGGMHCRIASENY